MNGRGSGVLLHLTSLPSGHGIGDLGPSAYEFANFLSAANQRFWQILPVHPTDPAYGETPYSSISAFAANPLFVSPEILAQEGLLSPEEMKPSGELPVSRVAYRSVRAHKQKLLDRAYRRFRAGQGDREGYERFCGENSYWLDDFILFAALREGFNGRTWNEWPPELRDRNPEALKQARARLEERTSREMFLQYLTFKQWFALKEYLNRQGIQIIGDLPYYVNLDSVDVWQSPELFKLDEEKRPTYVAGVPPDYFSRTGQLWGNPIYRWGLMQERGFDWWVQRIRHALHLFDILRVDHFRGFVAYWEIQAEEKTAVNGKWVPVPAEDLFTTLLGHFPHLPIIAEDLGFITPDVREVMRRFAFPGMKVLLFAFGEDHPMHPYLPHTYETKCMAYTGTHDNNTVRGWFEEEADPAEKRRLFRYLGREVSTEKISWEMIRLAMASVADTVILPMQDLLGLGAEARMNRPATTEGNWQWRLSREELTPSLAARLSEMTRVYGRGRAD